MCKRLASLDKTWRMADQGQGQEVGWTSAGMEATYHCDAAFRAKNISYPAHFFFFFFDGTVSGPDDCIWYGWSQCHVSVTAETFSREAT